MGMNVNEPWCDEQTGRVNLFFTLANDSSADLGQQAPCNGNITHELRAASAIDDGAVSNH
jgi:hypothetical protein